MRFGARARGRRCVVELVWALTQRGGDAGRVSGAARSARCATIGRALFTDYAFAFEVTSMLILVAMVGAVVLARQERGVRR